MKKIVISGMIGNALEWYDYALYAQFATIISMHFFPANSDPQLAMLATFAVYAVGFIVRPVGAIFFGWFGDKFGRKAALSAAILLMALPTTAIGLLPTYEQIGILAPILLTVIRLLQGLSLGGEFSGCIAYLVESAPQNKRGFIGSAAFTSMCGGLLLGSLIANLLIYILPTADLISWGWRLPFLSGIIIGLVGFHIRMHLKESPIYQQARENNNLSKKPIREVIKNYRKELILAIGLYLSVAVPFHTITVFINNFATTELHQPEADTLLIYSIALIFMIIIMPFSSYISDKIGRKPVLVISSLAIVFASYPMMWMLTEPGFKLSLASQILFASVVAFYMGPIPTTLVELFPTRVRFTGVALSYNLSAALFGGTAPMIGYWLINATQSHMSYAYYLIFFCMLTVVTLSFFTDRYKEPLY